MISQRWILLGLLAALTLLGACSADLGEAPRDGASQAAATQGHDEHEGGEEGHEDEEASPLTMSAEQLEAAGVHFETLAQMALAEELPAPGEVLENAYWPTLITPSIPGLVVKRHARLGDKVKAGTLLVTLSSIEVAQAQGELQLAGPQSKIGIADEETIAR